MTTSDANLLRYRRIAADVRGGDLFEYLVRTLALGARAHPAPSLEAEFADICNFAWAVLKERADSVGFPISDAYLTDLAGAIAVEALASLEIMSTFPNLFPTEEARA